jgi:hypothetical protein
MLLDLEYILRGILSLSFELKILFCWLPTIRIIASWIDQ